MIKWERKRCGVDRWDQTKKRWRFMGECRICVKANNGWNSTGNGRNKKIESNREKTPKRGKEP